MLKFRIFSNKERPRTGIWNSKRRRDRRGDISFRPCTVLGKGFSLSIALTGFGIYKRDDGHSDSLDKDCGVWKGRLRIDPLSFSSEELRRGNSDSRGWIDCWGDFKRDGVPVP